MPRKKSCPLCGGQLRRGQTSLEFEREGKFYVVRHVPAEICTDCGKALIDQEILEKIEALIDTGQPVESIETPMYDLAVV